MTPSLRVPLTLLLLGVLLTLLFTCCGGGAAESEAPRSNVLLVTLDTTRPDWLGCYGGERAATPHIDRVAREGVLFERAIATAGITPMSHASILSGLNNYAHGMRVFYSEEVSHQLDEGVRTLPEILKERGYRTAAMVSAFVVSEVYNLDQGFDDFLTGIDTTAIDFEQQPRDREQWGRISQGKYQRRSDATADEVLGWLGERAAEEEPWCLWLHLFDVHDYCLVPPEEFIADYEIEMPPEGSLLDKTAQHQWRERMYGPEMTWMDAQLGRVLEWLRENGQYEDTIVVITADHAQGLLDGLRRHGWGKHRLLYDWCLRVPLIVKIPGRDGSRVVAPQVRTTDILPTILEVLDVPLETDLDGESLLALIDGQSESQPRLAYADALNLYDAFAPKAGKLPPGHHDNLYCATDGEWKLVWRVAHPERGELFNLATDPLEASNLFTLDHPEVVRLKAWLDEQDAWRIAAPGEQTGPVNPAALHGMGYGGDDGEGDDADAPVDDGTRDGDQSPR